MSRDRPARPPLSVVVATTRPWPAVAVALESMDAQAVSLGVEGFSWTGTAGRSTGRTATRACSG
jgi:hypothetical protein